MWQVLFRIPIFQSWIPGGVPIYGFGMMLFLTFLVCTWLIGRRAERVGVAKEVVQDMTIWIFLGGLVGARVLFLFQETNVSTIGDFLTELPKIWDGGIILYGSVLGGLAGYFLYWAIYLRKLKISTLKLADIVAPCIAVGIALGRVGCFLNGCCFGQVACADCAAYQVHFPLSAPARFDLVHEGVQTVAGFTVDPSYRSGGIKVDKVEPESPAAKAGLQSGDVITHVDGREIKDDYALTQYLGAKSAIETTDRLRGKNDLALTVQGKDTFTIRPTTLGLHPTQLYETISMLLVLLLLYAYEPFKTRDGQLMVVMMLTYAVHRYLNELLRADPRPIGFERHASLFLFGAGIVMALLLRLRPAQYKPQWTVATI
jgi:prolipoprotein diacylglyceryltransferase